MDISRDLLMEALAKVKPGLSTKEFIEQTTSFAFIKGRVVTYNDEISISHPIENMDIEGAIQAEPLYALLSKLKQDTVKIVVKGKEMLIRAGRVKAGFKLEQEIKLPLEEIGEKKKWKRLSHPSLFLKGLQFVSFTCSKDITRPVLTCVNVRQSGLLEATDNYRISTYKVDELPVADFLLPVNAVYILVKYDINAIAETHGWVHFKTREGTILSARTYTGDFPDVVPHLKVKGYKLSFPAILTEILERSLVFAKKEIIANSSIEVALSDNKIKVKGDADAGWFEEFSKVEYDSEPVTFIINPLFLLDIAKENKYKAVLAENGGAILFSSKVWSHLVMLRI